MKFISHILSYYYYYSLLISVVVLCDIVQVSISHQNQLETINSQVSGDEEFRTIEEEATTFFKEFWEATLEMEPEFATAISVHRYNDRLTNFSLQAYELRKENLRKFIRRARQLLQNCANQADRYSATFNNLELFISLQEYQLAYLMTESYLFAVSYLDGPHVSFLSLLEYMPMKTIEDGLNLISRFKSFPQQIEEIIGLMNEGIRRNMTLHSRSLKNLDSIFSSFQVPVVESPFYEPFKKLEALSPQAEYENIKKRAFEAIDEYVLVAFQRLKDYMEKFYKEHTRIDIGVSNIPNGVEFYQNILKFFATDDVNIRQIHSLGKAEVKRIRKEMKKVIKTLGFNLTIQEFNEFLRNDPTQKFSSQEDVLEAYRNVLQIDVPPLLPTIFKNIPKAKLEIQPAPDNMAGGPRGFYQIGTPDGSTPGTFFADVSTISRHPKYLVTALALHEGIPGHHLQVSYSMEQKNVPDFRKYFLQPMSAYVEGWGLYSEYLGYELGLYNTPYKKYGHLSEEIFRASRLVVDTGIHALGWNRNKAVNYMLCHTASPRSQIESEVDRYITWPGQACSYKYGEIKIKALRKESENSTRFDVKEFHDVVLSSYGPLAFVEQQIGKMKQQQN